MDETTTGMSEKLLDAERASCVSDFISTDAPFLLAVRGLPQFRRVIRPGLNPLQRHFKCSLPHSRTGSESLASYCVASSTHSRHLNFTVEFLRSAVIAIKSRSVVHSELDFMPPSNKKPKNK